MKRKLWIAAATAILLAVLWCGMAMAGTGGSTYTLKGLTGKLEKDDNNKILLYISDFIWGGEGPNNVNWLPATVNRYVDPDLQTILTTEPETGDSFYCKAEMIGSCDPEDEYIDFSQINLSQVHVKMAGYTVEVLGASGNNPSDYFRVIDVYCKITKGDVYTLNGIRASINLEINSEGYVYPTISNLMIYYTWKDIVPTQTEVGWVPFSFKSYTDPNDTGSVIIGEPAIGQTIYLRFGQHSFNENIGLDFSQVKIDDIYLYLGGYNLQILEYNGGNIDFEIVCKATRIGDAVYDTITYVDPVGGETLPCWADHNIWNVVSNCYFTPPEGYGFYCWKLGNYFYYPGDIITVTEDITLVAQWRKLISIQFNPNGGTGEMEPISMFVGDKLILPECPFTPPDGYEFDGWMFAGQVFSPGTEFFMNQNETFTAQWKKRCTITFNSNGGTGIMNPATVLEGDKYTLPACTYTFGNNVFANWKIGTASYAPGDRITVTQNITVTAVWTYRYVVSFDARGHGTAPASQIVVSGTTAAQPENPEAAGWVFGGWYTNTDFAPAHKYHFTEPVTANLKLYAWWGHTVSFDLTSKISGYPLYPQYVHEGDKATERTTYMNEPYQYWINTGWYTEPECVNAYDFNQVVTSNITLYAKWNWYGSRVTYDWNGQNITGFADKHNKYDIEPGEPVSVYYQVGRSADNLVPLYYGDLLTFLGWYTEPECVHLYDFENSIIMYDQDFTLYAKWGENHALYMYKYKPEVTHVSPSRFVVPYNATPSEVGMLNYSLTHHDEFPGWAFAGWFTDPACTVPFDPDALLTQHVSIYCKWETAVYTVIFDMNGGTGENIELTCHYGDVISRPETIPEKTDFVCNAWYCEELNIRMWATGGYVQWTCSSDATFKASWIPDGIRIDGNYAYSFPDEAFRNYVLQHFDTDGKTDADGNHYLSAAERDAVTTLDFTYYTGTKFTSLQGIEYFPKLETLICPNQQLTELNLSQNTELVTLKCGNNQITALNLNKNTKLATLSASNNALTSVNAIGCTELAGAVYLYNNPDLTSVQLAAPGITNLEIQFTSITSIDLSGCPNLGRALEEGYVTLVGNEPQFERHLKTINGINYCVHVTPGISLNGFITSGLLIDEAHFPDPGFRAFVKEKFDHNGNGALTENEITAAYSISTNSGKANKALNMQGLEYLTNIHTIDANNMGLTELDVSQNPLIASINLYNNELTELDVSALSNLSTLTLDSNTGLQSLTLGSAPVHYLSARNVPYLTQFDLSGQPLLLKAYMEGTQTEDEDNIIYYYRWTDGHQSSMSGQLILRSGVDVLLPEWSWSGTDSAVFILPNGTEVFSEIRREISADGRTVSYTATATVSGVPFTDSKTFCLVTFADADVPAQEINEGDYAERPGDPFIAGSVFDGWYRDSDYSTPYTFADPVTEGFTVYAKWITPAVSNFLKLPAAMETVESEAFSGIPAQAVIVPGSVTSIAYDAFYLSSIEYIYGFPGTRAETFADAYGFTFIPIDDAWMASH